MWAFGSRHISPSSNETIHSITQGKQQCNPSPITKPKNRNKKFKQPGERTHLKDGLVDVGEGAAARARAGDLLGAAAVLVEDGALGDDDDVATRELLLELADELLLDAVVLLEETVRHKHDDGLGAAGDVDLLSSGDVKILQVDLDLRGGDLQVEELLSDQLLELVGSDAVGLDDFLASGEHGCNTIRRGERGQEQNCKPRQSAEKQKINNKDTQ